MVALAAPQLFTRPGSGVSNIPTELAAFAAPQFGDVADAVNAATGNVYFDLGALNRNNTTKPGDDTVSTTGGLRVNGLLRLSGFSPTMNPATIPQEWSVAQGDGSYDLYRRASSAEIDAAPTWINERYANIRGGVAFYIRKTQTGLQTDEQWLVTFQLANSCLISHLYDRAGNRTTFYNDGEYPDYTQTLHQQYRTAKYRNDAEGIDPTAPKTEFTYTAPGNGHLSKVKDEWGRVTTYEWDDALNRLDAVNMLVQDEANPRGSWKRRIEYAYDQIGGQYYVTYMVHRTYDATGNPIGRWFDLNYIERNGHVLLSGLGRPRAIDQTDGPQPAMVYTTYTYDGSNRVSTVKTPGEADISFTYGTSTTDGGGGQRVIRQQGEKQLNLDYTPDGWLRSQTERDFNPHGGLGSYDRTLQTVYWYDGAGRVLAQNLPGGAQIQNVYDTHGNKIRETVYRNQVAWAWVAPRGAPPAGYERTTEYEYDRDNQVTNTIQAARSGTVTHPFESAQTASYSYGTITRLQPLDYYSASAGNQAFQALSRWNDNLAVDGTWVSAPNHFFDEYGRLIRTQSHADGTPTVNTDYEYHGGTAQVWRPTASGDIDWSRPRGVRNFGDQVHLTWTYENGQSRDSGKRTQTYYDEFGNPAWVNLEKWIGGKWTAGTAAQRDLQQFAAYNGFGQQEWAYSRTMVNASSDVKEESKSLTKYFTSGEPKYSFTGNPGNLTNFKYDINGQLTELKVGAGANELVTTPRRTTTYEYDAYGRKASETTAGRVTTFEYDTRDNLAKQVNPDGSVVRKQYNNGTGALYHEQIGRAGEPTRFTYHDLDSLGREFRTLSNTSAGNKIVDTLYDPNDRPIRITNHALTMNVDLKDRSTYLQYDTLGRLVKKLDPALITNGSPYLDARRPYTEYGYDWRGRQTKETTLLYGATITPESMVMPQGVAIATKETEFGLFDQPVKVTDAAGYWTKMQYDFAGNVTTLTKEIWKGTEKDYAVANSGFMTTTTQMAYNASGKPSQVIDVLGNSSYTDYDINGNVTISADARGIVTKAFLYTADNLLESIWEPDNNAGTTAKYGEVSLGNLMATHQVMKFNKYGSDGSFKPITSWRAHMNTQAGLNSGARTDYAYDYAGRVTVMATQADVQGRISRIETSYDSSGNVIKTIDANGFPTVNEYDVAGNLISKHDQARPSNQADIDGGLGEGLLSTYKYDLSGNLIFKNERNLITEYKYNSLGGVVTESHPRIGSDTIPYWKLNTYRLDGLKTVATSYLYQGNLSSQSHITQIDDSSLTVSAGNATIMQYNTRGDLTNEVSLAAKKPDGTQYNRFQEYSYSQWVNGDGKRYRKDFRGSKDIYTIQKSNEVEPLKHANNLSYWRWDGANNLIEKWDTPLNSANGEAINVFDRQNWFYYKYSQSGNEVQSERSTEVREKSIKTNNNLYNYGGSSGIYFAASKLLMTLEYNERDELIKTTISDKFPYLSSDNQPMQDKLGASSNSSQYYTYYSSGQVKSESNGYASKSYDEYDYLGRETKIYDSNGAVNYKTGGSNQNSTTISPYRYPATIEISYGNDASITKSASYIDGSGKKVILFTDKSLKSVGGLTIRTNDIDGLLTLKYGGGASDALKNESRSASLTKSYSKTFYYNGYGLLADEVIKSNSKTITNSFGYDGDGTKKSEGSSDGVNILSYQTDSKGNSVSLTSGSILKMSKRYNSEGLVSRFNSTEYYDGTSSGPTMIRFNDYRYDPYGRIVISSTAQLEEGQALMMQSDNRIYGVYRDWNNTYYANDKTEQVIRRGGAYRYGCNEDDSGNVSKCSINQDTYRNNSYQVRDASYSLVDGWVETSTFTATAPFAVHKQIGGFASPVKNLSAILKIDPLHIETQSLPKLIDPSKIFAPFESNSKEGILAKIEVNYENSKYIIQSDDNKNTHEFKNDVFIREVDVDFNDYQGFDLSIYGLDDYPKEKFETWLDDITSVDAYSLKQAADMDSTLETSDKAAHEIANATINLANRMGLSSSDITNLEDTFSVTSEMSPIERVNRNTIIAMTVFGASQGYNKDYLAEYLARTGKDARNYKASGQDKGSAMDNLSRSIGRVGDSDKINLPNFQIGEWGHVPGGYRNGRFTIGSYKDGIYALLSPEMGVINRVYSGEVLDSIVLGTISKAAGISVRDLKNLGKTFSKNYSRKTPGGTYLRQTSTCSVNSFVSNTLVRTISGLVAISALSIGTPVLAFNEQTGKDGYYPITEVHKNVDPEITYLTLTDPDNKNKLEFVETTPEHPFYVTKPVDAQPRPAPEGHGDLSRNWVGAGHLKIGDKIKQADGTTGLVANVTTVQQTREMFNLTVSEAHTYYVGQDGWLVHNERRAPVGPYDRFNYGYGPPTTIEQKALDIIYQLNGGANRVTYYINNGLTQVNIDLGGSMHNDKATNQKIPTPHIQIKQGQVMRGGPNAGQIGNFKETETRLATMQDLRNAEQILIRRSCR